MRNIGKLGVDTVVIEHLQLSRFGSVMNLQRDRTRETAYHSGSVLFSEWCLQESSVVSDVSYGRLRGTCKTTDEDVFVKRRRELKKRLTKRVIPRQAHVECRLLQQFEICVVYGRIIERRHCCDRKSSMVREEIWSEKRRRWSE